MRKPNYLVSIYVADKCVELFYSEDLCELHVCRLLHKGCEIEVHDMRKFCPMPNGDINKRERESVKKFKERKDKKEIPESVVCLETKEIFPSVSVCADEIGIQPSKLMDGIMRLVTVQGHHYQFLSTLYDKVK